VTENKITMHKEKINCLEWFFRWWPHYGRSIFDNYGTFYEGYRFEQWGQYLLFFFKKNETNQKN